MGVKYLENEMNSATLIKNKLIFYIPIYVSKMVDHGGLS